MLLIKNRGYFIVEQSVDSDSTLELLSPENADNIKKEQVLQIKFQGGVLRRKGQEFHLIRQSVTHNQQPKHAQHQPLRHDEQLAAP